MPRSAEARRVWSWALYDWANSAFATAVMAGFFPVFFREFWATGVASAETTFRLGLVNSIASLLVVVLAPVLGAIADRAGARKGLLLIFACLGIVMSGGLYLVEQGAWAAALLLYLAAVIGFSGGNVFYDALLIGVAPERDYDRVSALGYALGYLGGGLLFAFDVWMTLDPARFGLAGTGEAVRLAFLTVAIWWGVFSLPLLLWVPEPPVAAPLAWRAAIGAGLRQLSATIREVRRLRVTFLFLVAYWLYIDGVDTIVRMAVDYGLALGFASTELMTALLLTQFIGFPAALLFGRLGDRIGAKRGILIAIGVYLAVIVGAYRMQDSTDFYLLAAAIGLVQGGIQALSRSLYARLIPPTRSAEFFGFYNMLGKFAAVLGPLLMGAVAVATGSARVSILSVALLFIAGALLLWRIDPVAGQRAARGG